LFLPRANVAGWRFKHMNKTHDCNPGLRGDARLQYGSNARAEQDFRLVQTPLLLRQAWRWLRTGRIVRVLLGLALRPDFQRAGVVEVVPGWPFPNISNRGRIEVGNCAFFPGVRIECWRGGRVSIGTGTYLNRNAEIVAAGAVTIGRDCKIARDVLIMDTDQHPLPERGFEVRPVTIGDNVWIGARAIIRKGVTLGSGCIVGAGAVVTSDVPPHAVAVGPHSHLLSAQRSA
jgi:acetyltransferase-like isoleucine patch superfamily enzyme